MSRLKTYQEAKTFKLCCESLVLSFHWKKMTLNKEFENPRIDREKKKFHKAKLSLICNHAVLSTTLNTNSLLLPALLFDSPLHTGLVFCWPGPLARDRAPTWPLRCCTIWTSCQCIAWICPPFTLSALRHQRSRVLRYYTGGMSLFVW